MHVWKVRLFIISLLIFNGFTLFMPESSYARPVFSALQMPHMASPDCGVRLNTQLVSQTGGRNEAVAVNGHYVYTSFGYRLTVLDGSTAAQPTLVAELLLDAPISDMAIAGNYAFVGTEGAGLQVVDITTPTAPKLVGQLRTPASIRHITVGDQYAYVAGSGAALYILDIRNPVKPFLVSHLLENNTGNFFTYSVAAIAVTGHTAYLSLTIVGPAISVNELAVVDVTDPLAPVIKSTYYSAVHSTVTGFAITDHYLYLTRYNAEGHGLYVLDIANPIAPTEIRFLPLKESPDNIRIVDRQAYLAASGSLQIFDITKPTSPKLVKQINTQLSFNQIALNGDFLYATYRWDGLHIFQIAPSNTARAVGLYNTTGTAELVMFSGDYAYVTHSVLKAVDPAPIYSGVIQVYKIVNLPSLQFVNAMTINGHINALVPNGAYAYLAVASAGLRVLDMANPAAPVEIGSLATPGLASALALHDHYAYMADGPSGLQVIDLATSAKPQLVGSRALPGIAYDVVVSDTLAYVADGNSGLQIVNIANPTHPQVIGTLPIEPEALATHLAIGGHYVYLANDLKTGVLVIDVADPTAPHVIANIPLVTNYERLILVDHLLYILHAAGLQVFDVTEPAAPIETGNFRLKPIGFGSASGFAFAQDYIYLADGADGLLTLRFARSYPTTFDYQNQVFLPLVSIDC